MEIKPEPLPSIAGRESAEICPETFADYTQGLRAPVVVRGFARNTAAVDKWSFDFFHDEIGSTRCAVMDKADYVDLVSDVFSYKHIAVRELVENIRSGGSKYGNNMSTVFADHPGLVEDLELGRLDTLRKGASESVMGLGLFAGGPGSGSQLHCAHHGNFFLNVVGRKKWTFISPELSVYTNALASRPFLYAHSDLDLANAKEGDYVLKLPRYEVVLEPGDLLCSPAWWWHCVQNVTPFTIACAARLPMSMTNYTNNAIFTLNSMAPALDVFTMFQRYVLRIPHSERMRRFDRVFDEMVMNSWKDGTPGRKKSSLVALFLRHVMAGRVPQG